MQVSCVRKYLKQAGFRFRGVLFTVHQTPRSPFISSSGSSSPPSATTCEHIHFRYKFPQMHSSPVEGLVAQMVV